MYVWGKSSRKRDAMRTKPDKKPVLRKTTLRILSSEKLAAAVGGEEVLTIGCPLEWEELQVYWIDPIRTAKDPSGQLS